MAGQWDGGSTSGSRGRSRLQCAGGWLFTNDPAEGGELVSLGGGQDNLPLPAVRASIAASSWREWFGLVLGPGRGGGGCANAGRLPSHGDGGDTAAWVAGEGACFHSELCGAAGSYSNGAPPSLPPASRARGALGASGGGWRGSWWGRGRRRGRMEEGRDVSGKSWEGW